VLAALRPPLDLRQMLPWNVANVVYNATNVALKCDVCWF
jgi:hypothetical protein